MSVLECGVGDRDGALAALAAGYRFEGFSRTATGAEVARFARLAGDPPGPVPPAFAPLPPTGLSDGVVLLRVTSPGDVGGFLEQERDPLTLSVGATALPPPPDAVRRMADRAGLDWLVGTAVPLTIVDAASGAFAGSMRLRRLRPWLGDIGYVVHPRFRGRGYTTRALRLLTAWAFADGGFARLELGARVDNVASQRAAIAAGFAPEGIMRARLRAPDGSYADEARFSLLSPSAG